LINGLGSLAVRTESDGVAYMAHVGGFVAGVVLVKLLAVNRPAVA
jgi:membrane associated rhomboid family serine protease